MRALSIRQPSAEEILRGIEIVWSLVEDEIAIDDPLPMRRAFEAIRSYLEAE